MANNYDFSDSNITFLPESARGSLRDQIASLKDANMGKKRVYLNSEEWKEYQSFQKVKESHYPKEQEKHSEKSGISPLMSNQANLSLTKPNLYDKIGDVNRMKPYDILKVDDLYISFFERRRNSEIINKYNEENKVENNTADFSKLKWGKEVTLAPIQAKDGSITYVCYETAKIPLENGNTISIVKKENGTYSYFTLDKNNNVTSSSHNMPKEEVAYLLKLNANDIKNKQENISSNTPSHVYPNLDNFDTIKLNDHIKISGISAAGELVSREAMIYKHSLIEKYNKENIVENHTDDFSKIKWGKKLVYDRERQAFDASSTYICVESADFPLVGGLTINITKQGNGYIYSLLDIDKEPINSFYTEDVKALADKLKANGRLIKKENENSEQNVNNADKKEISDEPISIYLERIRHRQQEFWKGKEEIAPKMDNSKKITPTTINKETMEAYVAEQMLKH